MNIRRPLRGLEIKKDTYAVIKVIDATGQEINLINSSSPNEVDGIGHSNHYANFVLVGVTEQRAEKQQVVETFGEDYIFFFGEQPRILSFNAIVINTNDFNWKSEFWTNYENTFRGTRLLERNARMYIYFDDVVVEGYMLQAQQVGTAENPYHLPLQFQLFVTNYAILSNVGSVFIPKREAAAVQDNKISKVTDRTNSVTALQANTVGDLQSATTQGGGSLTAFLAQAQQFQQDATFSVQQTLENVRNAFFQRQVVVPDGIGNQIALPDIQNKAKFDAAPTGQPIFTMRDEYIESEGLQPQFDKTELARVQGELELRTPEQLERRAREELTKRGVDVSDPKVNQLLYGRAAFAGLQMVGSFGIRRADGVLNLL